MIVSIVVRICHADCVRHFVFPLVILLLSCTLTLCCSGHKAQEQSRNEFPVITPIQKDTVFTLSYVADIQAIQNIELRTRVTGFIEKIHVDEGQAVKAGQLLFSLGSQTYREALRKAKALLKGIEAEALVAETELKNTKVLVTRKVISKTDQALAEAKLDAIYAQIEEAKADVSAAALAVSYTEIKAPFAGIINRIPHKAGSLVQEGTLLTSLSDIHAVYAYFNLSEREYLELASDLQAPGHQTVKLMMANNQPYALPGVIETVDAEIDAHTGTLGLRARFENPKQLLKHGASGKVLIPLPLPQAVLIPQKATFDIQENTCVYVVDEAGKVSLRPIVPGVRIAQWYTVQSGLTPDDMVLYEGIQRVQDGDQITPHHVSLQEDAQTFTAQHQPL